MSHVQSVSEISTATVHTLVFASTPTNGNAIVVFVGLLSGTNIFTSLVDSEGNTYDEATGPGGFNAGGRRCYAFLAENYTGTGTCTVTLTMSTSSTIHWGIAEYNNVPTSSVLDAIITGTFGSGTSATSSNIATGASNATIIGYLRGLGGMGGISAAGGSTERQEPSTSSQFQDKLAGAAGNYTSAWTWVTAQGGGYIVLALKAPAAAPAITSVDSDNQITAAQTGVVILGTAFGGDGANAKIELIDGTNGAIISLCTKTAWTDTSITCTIVQGNVRYGAAFIKITTNVLQTDTHAVTLNVQSGATQYTNMTALLALAFDSLGKPTRVTPKGSAADVTADFAGITQIEMTRSGGTGAYQVDPNGRFQWVVAMTQGTFRGHDGSVWSPLIIWDLRGLFPTFPGPAIPDRTYTQNVPITPLAHVQRFADVDAPPPAAGGVFAIQGSPPAGLTWDASTGLESGTPTALGVFSGLKLRYTDADGSFVESGTFARTIEAAPNPPLFTGTIPNSQGVVSVTLVPIAAGAFFTFCTSFAITVGALPPGLTLNTATGQITGTPTVGGVFSGIVMTGSGTGTPADSNAFTIEILAFVQVIAPELTSQLETDAVTLIVGLGLREAVVHTLSTPANAGRVITQSPSAGTPMDPGAILTIVVGTVLVPNLFALTPGEAAIKVAPLGYTVGTVTAENSQQLPGRIIRQTPAAFSTTDPSTVINVVVGQEMNLGARTKRRWE